MLLERLLLLGVRITDLHLKVFAIVLDRGVVEGLDHFFADVTRFETMVLY